MQNPISPYVRLAMHHRYIKGYYIERSIWDHEIIFINSGQMKVTINDKVYIVKENDCVILRPNILHKIEWHEEDCEQPHVHFDFFQLSDSEKIHISMKRSEHMTIKEKTFFRSDYFKENHMDLPDVIHLQKPYIVKDLLYQIIEEFTYKVNYSGYILKGLMTQLIGAVLRDYHLGKVDEFSIYARNLTELIFFMEQNVDNNLSLDDLANQAKMGKWNLNRLFSERYGFTPISYFHRLKYNHAKKYLLYTTKSIKEIAYQMNFDSPQSFSRWFKKNDGNPPIKYHQRATVKQDD